VAEYVREALGQVPEVEDWIDEGFLRSRGWPTFKQALHMLHYPGVLPITA
jgi:ATP-dependent DNA helicase RecG